MANGFDIDEQGIREVSRELEREFAKCPIRVPLETDCRAASLPAATTVNNYNEPVVTVNGDHARLAWGNQNVAQAQAHSHQVTSGYERLAQLLADILASLPSFQLNENDGAELRESANIILREVVKPEPDQSIVRRSITLIKGLLALIGIGLGRAATEKTAEAAREVIEVLGMSLPF